MPTKKKSILIKLSGELFSYQKENSNNFISSLIQQIKQLKEKCFLSFVLGGGNFFRGRKQGKELNLSPSAADEIGMIATIMNGRIFQENLETKGVGTILLSALYFPQVAKPICHDKINYAIKNDKNLIFVGGTGNPYFSTDTTAVLRALQVGALEVWKATKVAGIYDDDPTKNPNAKLIKKISYDEAIAKKLKIMDLTSFTLAKKHGLKIRVFNLFEKDALLNAARDPSWGSVIV